MSVISNGFSNISTNDMIKARVPTQSSRLRSASQCGWCLLHTSRWKKYIYRERERENVEKVEGLEVSKIRWKIPNEGFRVA